MDQFQVTPLFGADKVEWFTITNVTLWMGLTIATIVLILVFGARGRALVPTRSQSVAELAYGFIYKMVEDVTGKDGLVFFPYIMTLFMFILVANFLGLLPMAFTTTSHIAVTAVMAMAVFLAVTIIGFVKNGFGFLAVFWISSAPLILRPILALIEIISYFVRPCEPLHSFGRKYDGGPRCYQSFCSICTFGSYFDGYRSGGYATFDPRDHSNICPRSACSLHSGLCFRNSNLCLSARCIASAPLGSEL